MKERFNTFEAAAKAFAAQEEAEKAEKEAVEEGERAVNRMINQLNSTRYNALQDVIEEYNEADESIDTPNVFVRKRWGHTVGILETKNGFEVVVDGKMAFTNDLSLQSVKAIIKALF